MTGSTVPDGFVYEVPGDVPGVSIRAGVGDTLAEQVQAKFITNDAALSSVQTVAAAAQYRLATTIRTTSTASITSTETEINSVTATLVAGKTYRVRWTGRVVTAGGGTVARLRFRDDSIGGPALGISDFYIGFSNRNQAFTMEDEYTAVASGSKTFVASAVAFGGPGDITFVGTSTTRLYLYVDYIRG